MKILKPFLMLSGPALLISNCCNEKTLPEKLNFLFILADDLGYHDLSFTGSRYYETPNIDRMAKGGMVFSNGYSNCQVSSPSRGSIMTGKFTARHGITNWIGEPSGIEWRKMGRNNQLLPAEYLHQLPLEYTILPEAMKQNGYKTFFAGKWHLGGEGSMPEDHGFDINKGGGSGGGPSGGYFSPWNFKNLENRQDGEELSTRLAKETVVFMKENKDAPFFAYLSFYAVHSPIQCSEEKWKKYRQKAEDLGIAPTGYKMGRSMPIRQAQDNPVYAGLVEAMDDAVGIVLDELKNLGLEDNTIVIFTSDNGGEASAGEAPQTSNLPLRAGKGYQYEGGIRVPYFIRVPGLTKGGEKCDVPVCGADFYPTILDLAGLPLRPDDHNDGVSLFPLLKGGEITERPLIWHYPHYGNQGGEPSSIIRSGKWKLIHYYEDGRNELFNLNSDPGEHEDVSADNPDMVKKMSQILTEWLLSAGARYPERDPEYNEALKKRQLEDVMNIKLPMLEKQRMEYLSKDFDPENNWWGSKVSGPDY